MQQQGVRCAFSSSDSWVILSPIEQSIKRKIEAVGTPLKDWDIQINYGIKTGFNDAFIISTEKRDEILANCRTEEERERTAELIRPILRGRDIKRYGYEWADLWIINTHNGIKRKFPRIDVNEYPAIKAHLDQYWDKISKRADRGDTPYNLRNCAYMEDFMRPKVMWKIIGCNINFCYDEKQYICNNAVDIMVGDKSRLIQFVGLMNSKLFDWYLKLTTEAEVQGGGIQLYVTTLEKTLMKLDFSDSLTNTIYQRISGLIDDKVVDDKIFDAYLLTQEERMFILNDKRVTRNRET
ncbi:TaqI-like C-terminal specificity domain-containing protein [Rikenella microfusus]|uniref:site-specific DNA-methyltransferase (adenine-specific) n=1 Tax=Rikenella microfusus TaxID=28139 RepID=A0A379MNF6_9BACT|nr:TaqI-like C-terminal specificity domain-containing protein [Rikenella microfusus]SUE33128.1 TaqI-like C-terminal specificity domain [Rikenella microfusus]